MQLEWLRGQLMFLKKAGVAGFAELPDEMRLEPRSLGGERSRLLYLVGGSREFTIGVGYDSTRNLKDGGLRVSMEVGVDLKRRKRFDVISPGVFLDPSGAWWVLDDEKMTPVGLR